MLGQVQEALWVAEGEIVSFFGIAYPTRSVIARFGNVICGYGRQSS
jgi:hypothetical protein